MQGRHTPTPRVRALLPAPTHGAPGSRSQDTAAGATPTWPPASGDVDCTLYNTQPKDFSSCTQGPPTQTPKAMRAAKDPVW